MKLNSILSTTPRSLAIWTYLGIGAVGVGGVLLSAIGPATLNRSVPFTAVVLFAALFVRQDQRRRVQLDAVLKKQEDSLRDIQALLSIYAVVRPHEVLPATGGWAVTPEFAALLVSIVREKRPKLVIEASSGVSTVLIAYCLRELGCGKVISLEHEDVYRRQTCEELRRHGLSEVAEVVSAPLKPYRIGDREWLWYDLDSMPSVRDSCDLLVIDGPPANTQALARYPALPLLHQHLSPSASILLDDAARPDEQAIIERWRTEYPELRLRMYDHSKGTALLIRNSATLPSRLSAASGTTCAAAAHRN